MSEKMNAIFLSSRPSGHTAIIPSGIQDTTSGPHIHAHRFPVRSDMKLGKSRVSEEHTVLEGLEGGILTRRTVLAGSQGFSTCNSVQEPRLVSLPHGIAIKNATEDRIFRSDTEKPADFAQIAK